MDAFKAGKVLRIVCVHRGTTALTLRVQLVGAPSSRSSSLLPDPSFHAFRSGARTHRLGSKNIEPTWTGEVFLTAHLHRDWTAHAFTLSPDPAEDGREVWSCELCLPPLLGPLPGNAISGFNLNLAPLFASVNSRNRSHGTESLSLLTS